MNNSSPAKWWPRARPYLLTALAIAAAIPLRLLLDPILGDKMAFVTMFPIVIASAWYAGARPALLGTLLGTAGVVFFVMAPRYTFVIAHSEDRAGAVINVVICTACAALIGSLRHSRRLAEENAAAAAQRERELQREAAERIAAEASLRRSEAQFRAIFELSAVGQAQADPLTGRLLRVNHRFCEIVGYSEEELLELTFLDLTHPEDRERTQTELARLVRGEIPEYQMQKRYCRKDGGTIWGQVHVSLVPGGPNEPPRTAAIVQDITAAKQLEFSLRESEERFRCLFDQAAVGVGRSSLDRVVMDVNPGLCRMLGCTREELVGKTIRDLSHPDEYESSAAALQPLFAGLVESIPMERRFRHQAGHYIETHTVAALIRDGEGRPASIVAVVLDITERKRAEAGLKEADRRKDEFLATLAHELRNPLAPVCNSLHILRLTGGDLAAHPDLLEMMERQISHMVRLVDDLLEISRITRGKVELRCEPVELAAVVRSAVEASQPLIDAAGQQLAMTLPPEPIVLSADAVRLSQVLGNLLNNASKYTDSGGQIWLSARVEREVPGTDAVAISVRDTGVGIAPEMLSRVFDMFTQVSPARTRAHSGLGIGLALVKSLVELHGGRVEVKSAGLGQGSEFVVHLPLLSPTRSPLAQPPLAQPELDPPRAAEPTAGALPPRRILVVDDNRDAAGSLAVQLRRLGQETRIACGGAECLATLPEFRPAVILLDIGMPGPNGYEVARRIRERPEYADVVIIALTGWGQQEDRRKSQEAGFDQHLVKPVSVEQLLTVLQSLTSSGTTIPAAT